VFFYRLSGSFSGMNDGEKIAEKPLNEKTGP